MAEKKVEGYRPTTADIGSRVEKVRVRATKILYNSSGFFIFVCKGNFSVKGKYTGAISEGSEYLITGKVEPYRNGLTISAEIIEQVNDEQGKSSIIVAFLMDNIPNIPKKIARKLAEEYGDKVVNTLVESPSDCAKAIKALSKSSVKEYSSLLKEKKEYYETLLRLRLFELSHAQSLAAYVEFGEEVLDRVKGNPYVLIKVKGIGFETCEHIAAELNYDDQSPYRIEGAAVKTIIDINQSNGSTYVTLDSVRAGVEKLLGKGIKTHSLSGGSKCDSYAYNEALLLEGLEYAVNDKFIVIYVFRDNKCIGCSPDTPDARFSTSALFNAEVTIKKEVESFLRARRIVPDLNESNKTIDKIASGLGYQLGREQREAIRMAMFQPFCIITGGPGTGKTTISGILANYFRSRKIEYRFCAPTGRAAKRLSEAAGVDATTIHRLLQVGGENPDADGMGCFFGRGRDNPIPARVIVVDEVSMVDTRLFQALLAAIPPDSSLILIGDPNQLPSVGPGNLLSDLLSCDAIPRVKLNYVFRQADESTIAANAVRVLEGHMPISNEEDFTVIPASNDAEAVRLLTELYAEKFANTDVAILCPTKQNLMGSINLNSILQDVTVSDSISEIKVKDDLVLHCKDRVMQVRNNYNIEYYDSMSGEVEHGIFNGETGTVERIDFVENTCHIRFDDDRLVEYDRKQLSDIDLAYSMTVHKAQGCEFDTVIISLGKMNYLLSNRQLLYTAITRGKKRVIIIDSCSRMSGMISNNFERKRDTSLKDFLDIVNRRLGSEFS